jgi:hypothetical protein
MAFDGTGARRGLRARGNRHREKNGFLENTAHGAYTSPAAQADSPCHDRGTVDDCLLKKTVKRYLESL